MVKQRFNRGCMLLRIVALAKGAFIRLEAKPRHRRNDDVDPLFSISVSVGIFNAQEEHAAGMAGEEPIEERRARTSDMEEPSWRRREADSCRQGLLQSSRIEMAPVGHPLTDSRICSRYSSPGFSFKM